ncbi:MAG: hypothetical protein ACTSU5_11215 [Promethearchaeota archaeon]
MPVGLAVIEWDDLEGPRRLASYPEELYLQEDTVARVYAKHRYASGTELVVLELPVMKVASLFAGPVRVASGEDRANQILVLFFLGKDETPDPYEEGLRDVARLARAHVPRGDLGDIVRNLYLRLSWYPGHPRAARLAWLYLDDVTRFTLDLLREDGCSTRLELFYATREFANLNREDFDRLVDRLEDTGLVSVAVVPELHSDVLFLDRDFLVFLAPPEKYANAGAFPGIPADVIREYRTRVGERLEKTRETATSRDVAMSVASLLLEPANWSLYERLLGGPRPLEELVGVSNSGGGEGGVDGGNGRGDTSRGPPEPGSDPGGVERALESLARASVVSIIRGGDGRTYAFLERELFVETPFPTYQFNSIRLHSGGKTHDPFSLDAYLTHLLEVYWQEFEVPGDVGKILEETARSVRKGKRMGPVEAFPTLEENESRVLAAAFQRWGE